MLFSRTVLASTLAALASAQDFSSINPIQTRSTTLTGAQASRLVPALDSYISSLETQPAFTSVASVIQTAVESDVISSLEKDSTIATLPASAAIPTSVPTAWVTALPSDVKSYLASADAAMSSIESKELKGPAPTNIPRAMAAGVAMAGVGVVAMIL